jgi:hypothetical protein
VADFDDCIAATKAVGVLYLAEVVKRLFDKGQFHVYFRIAYVRKRRRIDGSYINGAHNLKIKVSGLVHKKIPPYLAIGNVYDRVTRPITTRYADRRKNAAISLFGIAAF